MSSTSEVFQNAKARTSQIVQLSVWACADLRRGIQHLIQMPLKKKQNRLLKEKEHSIISQRTFRTGKEQHPVCPWTVCFSVF